LSDRSDRERDTTATIKGAKDVLDTSEHYLTEEEEQLLLRIARDALHAWVRQQQRLDPEAYPLTPSLREKHGAFVTLRNHGELRGCIGYTANEEPLVQSVIENVINASSKDFRFPPVTADEIDDITISISALTPGDAPKTPFRRVNDIDEIVIGRDGLYIERPPSRGGLLLPQVAVDQGWDVRRFLAGVCLKASYPDGAWEQPGTDLYRFSAQVFSEGGNS
jgi:AmmeMemoRadiSam system protein A